MNRFFSLVKYDFLNTYNVNRLFKGDKKFLKILLGIFLIGYFVVLSWIANNFLVESLAPVGFGEVALIMSFLMSFMGIAMLGILKLAGAIFGGKDYNNLISMPINKKSIIMAKVFNVVLPTFLITLVAIVPGFVSYMVNVPNVDSLFIVRGIILILFIPLVPTAIAATIGTILLYVSSRFKYRNIFTIIIFLVFFLGVMFLPGLLGEDFVNNIVKNSTKITDVYYAIYPLTKFYIEGLVLGNILDMAIFIISSIAIFAVFVVIVDKFYLNINSRLLETSRKNNFQMTKQKEMGVIKTLMINEIKRYLSMPMVMLNVIIGGILFIIYGGIAIFAGEKSIAMIFEGNMFDPSLKIGLLVMIGAFCMLTTVTTGNTISLEGNKLWQLKVLPIKTIDVFKAKIMVNLAILVPSALIGGTLSAIGLKLGLLEGICAVLMILLVGVLGSMIGLLVNLKYYTLNWTSEIRVVKQSPSTMIMMFGGMAVIAALGFIFVKINMDINIYLAIITVGIVVGILVCLKLLSSWGVRRFGSINN